MANIYRPCDKRSIDSLIKYQNVLGEIQSIIYDFNCTNFSTIGDFNSDPFKDRFWERINEFAAHNGMNKVAGPYMVFRLPQNMNDEKDNLGIRSKFFALRQKQRGG